VGWREGGRTTFSIRSVFASMNSSSTLRLNARILMQTPPCLMEVRNSLVYDIALRVGEFWNHMPAHGVSRTSCPKGIIKCKNQRDFFSAMPG
jgi:hypothetical protein